MSSTTIILIFYVILAIVGLVCLYNGYDMKANGNLKIGWFVGQEIKKERCKDIPGFIETTYKPIMIFGFTVVIIAVAVLIICGIMGTTSTTVRLIQLAGMLILCVMFFWFNNKIKTATNKYIK